MNKTTIKDVARLAGVGIGTVSRVLNNQDGVSALTRERVLNAIQSLNFRPNASARRLPRRGGLRHMGVLSHPFILNFYSIAERLRGVQIALAEMGNDLELMLFSASSPEHLAQQVERIARNSEILGLLVVDLNLSEEQQAQLSYAHIPVVGLNNLRGQAWRCIGTDDHAGAVLATQHLLKLGHTRIAYIGDQLFDDLGFPTSQARYAGYAHALGEAQIRLRDHYVKLGTHSYEMAYAHTLELLSQAKPPTAIFAMSDLQAMGAWSAARDLGMRVPEQLSLVGYDDQAMSAYVGLTSVRQHLELSGRMGAKHLLALLENPDSTELLPVPTLPPIELIQRQTSAPPMS